MTLSRSGQRIDWLLPVASAAVCVLALALLTGRPPRTALAKDCNGTTIGLVPITELTTGSWLGHAGGLYPDDSNVPPAQTRASALALAAGATPLDLRGAPDAQGRIVLLSIGMSNTTQEFSEFVRIANGDAQVSDRVTIVDGAQGGQTAADIASPDAGFWDVVDSRLAQAGTSREQVQFVWMKEANRQPTGPADEASDQLKDDLAAVVQILHDRFPNLRIAYLSSRIYAGYATTSLNPEPYAYGSGFAVKWLIEAQIDGAIELNWNPAAGPVEAPLLLWGPYLWADGTTPRAADGLVWECDDFVSDGTHPAADARYKVATMLLDFMKTDPSARSWFLADPGATPAASPTQGSGVSPTPDSTPVGQPRSLRLRETPSGDAFWLTTADAIVQRRSQTLRPDRPAWLCAGVLADADHEWGFRFDGEHATLERAPIAGRETTVRAISADPSGRGDGPACVQVGELIDELPGEASPTAGPSGTAATRPTPRASETIEPTATVTRTPVNETPTPRTEWLLYLPVALVHGE